MTVFMSIRVSCSLVTGRRGGSSESSPPSTASISVSNIQSATFRNSMRTAGRNSSTLAGSNAVAMVSNTYRKHAHEDRDTAIKEAGNVGKLEWTNSTAGKLNRFEKQGAKLPNCLHLI
jgi:hypothetical protein